MEVSLQQILDAREQRAVRQKALLLQYGRPLVCFTMNIAGPVKVSPLIIRAFRWGLSQLRHRLTKERILSWQAASPVTGCEAFCVVDADARKLKDICIAIEEETPLGRLFDMDVLDVTGRKLERQAQRSCLVCGAPGRVCAAGRLHSAQQLQAATCHIISAHFAALDREKIAGLAVESLIAEVLTTPKPGLVDRRNTGSHTDMDMDTFIASAHALKPYFLRCVEIGQTTAQLPPAATFPLLRKAGLEAEKAMYRATNGINTHKGAIYTVGVLCGSLGRLWRPEAPFAETACVLSLCREMTAQAIKEDFAAMTGITAGERLYLEKGLTGIRGQMAAGLPAVADIGLPVYEHCLQKGLSPNDAGAITLVHLIARVEDTNLYHRGGAAGAVFARDAAQALLPEPTLAQIEALDDAFMARNLSPGGCADLLAATCFLQQLQQTDNPES